MNKRLMIQIDFNQDRLLANEHYQHLLTILAALGYQVELIDDALDHVHVSGIICDDCSISQALTVPYLFFDALATPKSLINYVIQLIAIDDLNHLQHTQCNKHALIDYHSRYKLLLLAYSQPEYRKIGPFVAQLQMVTEESFIHYKKKLLAIFALGSSKQNHSNVVQHLQGYFRPYISALQKQQLIEQIDAFRQGRLSLLVVINILNHYLDLYPNDYLHRQYYLTGYRDILQYSYQVLEQVEYVE